MRTVDQTGGGAPSLHTWREKFGYPCLPTGLIPQTINATLAGAVAIREGWRPNEDHVSNGNDWDTARRHLEYIDKR